MAIIYYPSNATVYYRNTVSASVKSLYISTAPNNIFFFDTASELAVISSSVIDAISASYAVTSSGYCISASYADQANLSNTAISSSYLSGSVVVASSYKLVGSFYNSSTNTGSYTLSTADDGKLVIFYTASTVEVSSSLPNGFNCSLYQSGSGATSQIVVKGEAGINVNNRSGQSGSAGQHAMMSLFRIGSLTNFVLAGDTA